MVEYIYTIPAWPRELPAGCWCLGRYCVGRGQGQGCRLAVGWRWSGGRAGRRLLGGEPYLDSRTPGWGIRGGDRGWKPKVGVLEDPQSRNSHQARSWPDPPRTCIGNHCVISCIKEGTRGVIFSYLIRTLWNYTLYPPGDRVYLVMVRVR